VLKFVRDAGQSRRACLVHAAVGLRCDACVGLRCDARSTARSGASGHDADSTRKDVHETNVHSDDLVLSQELASASQTETRLNASSSAGSGAGEEEAFGVDRAGSVAVRCAKSSMSHTLLHKMWFTRSG
jgi:hypothetical protein